MPQARKGGEMYNIYGKYSVILRGCFLPFALTIGSSGKEQRSA